MTSLSFETVSGDNCSKVGDTTISWREKGAGFPLLMISGFGTTKDIWEQSVTDRLAEKYRVIVFDNRGMGGSSAGEKEFNIRQFADDVRGLMEAIGIERAHVLGWSMGSLISQELALGFPEKVAKLVLYASFSDWSFPPSEDVIEKLSDPSGTSEERGMRWIETLFPLDWLEKNGERVEEIFSRPLGEIPGDSLTGQQKAIESWRGSTDRLDQIIIPTLILCGSEDVLAPPYNSEKLNKLIRGSKLQLVKGAGHGLMFQEPTLFATLVDDFLRAEAG